MMPEELEKKINHKIYKNIIGLSNKLQNYSIYTCTTNQLFEKWKDNLLSDALDKIFQRNPDFEDIEERFDRYEKGKSIFDNENEE